MLLKTGYGSIIFYGSGLIISPTIPWLKKAHTQAKGETSIRSVWHTSCRTWLHIPLGVSATFTRIFSLSKPGEGNRQILLRLGISKTQRLAEVLSYFC